MEQARLLDLAKQSAMTLGTQAAVDGINTYGLLRANNLSDVQSVPSARTNLGLGTMATQAASAVAITGGTALGLTKVRIGTSGDDDVTPNPVALEVSGGGTAHGMHVHHSYLGLSYVATGYNGQKSSCDMRSTRGSSLASLSPSLQYDVLGAFHIGGSHSTILSDCAQLYCYAAEDWGSGAGTAAGSLWMFYTQPAGSDNNKLPALQIDDDGGLILGAATFTHGEAVTSKTFAASADMPSAHAQTSSLCTFTSSFSTPSFPTAFADRASYVLGATSPGTRFKLGFANEATITNDPAISTSWGVGVNAVTGFRDAPTLKVDTATGRNLGQYYSFQAVPNITVANSGTWTAGSAIGVLTAPTVGTGVTLTSVIGLSVQDYNGSGTVTTAYGMDIAAMSKATTSWGIRSQTKVQFTAGIYGGTANGANLDLYSTSGTAGSIIANHAMSCLSTLAVTGHATLEGVTSTGATGTGKFVFDASPTLTGHPTIEGVTSTGATGTTKLVFADSPTFTTALTAAAPTFTGTTTAATITASSSIKSSSASAGIGYATGAGGTVTQLSSKATGVTLNAITGQITTHNSNLGGTSQTGFTLTNSAIASTDMVSVSMASGGSTDSYIIWCDAIASGSCHITIRNTSGGTLGEALVLRFVVVKSVNS